MRALPSRAAAAALLVAAALGVGACGDDEGDGASAAPEPAVTETATAPTETTETETETTESKGSAAKLKISKDLANKPAIPAPGGTAPSELVVQDVVEGKGKAAKAGDTVSVQYVGVLYDNGQEFDSSWSRGKQPFEFQLGAGMVIPGWDQGVAGMKEGGRRVLIIPADLAYGTTGQGSIPPNAALVFVVDVEKVT